MDHAVSPPWWRARTLQLARLVGVDGKVIAIEPTDFAYGKLKANLELNAGLNRAVKTHRAILGDGVEKRKYDDIYSSWPLTEGENRHEKHLGVPMSTAGARVVTMDALIEAEGLEEVALVKIDVDGHECEVLRGAKKTLSTYRPVIVMELAPYVLKERGCALEEVLELLRECGYKMYDERSGKEIVMSAPEIEAMVADGAGTNVVVKA